MASPRGDRDPAPERVELPVACTLEASDGAERLARWRTLIDMSHPEITREPGRIVVLLGEAPGVAAELDALAAAERECCSFAEWQVIHHRATHELRIHASSDGLDALASMFADD